MVLVTVITSICCHVSNVTNGTTPPPSISGQELITRDQILEIAHLYYAVEWRVDQDNVYSPGEIAGGLCAYSAEGWNTRIPYAWYGHDDIYEFLKKMMDVKGAGDIDTVTANGVPYKSGTVGGVECSGFVGETWKIPGQLFTSDIASSSLTTVLDWADLASGDAVNSAGHHVRLVDSYPYDSYGDKIRVYESTTLLGLEETKGVIRRVLPDEDTADFKIGYLPVRYNKISSKPSILSVLETGLGQVEVKWLGDVGDDSTHPRSGFRLYQSPDGDHWQLVPDKDETLLRIVDQSTLVQNLQPGGLYYFRVTSVKSGAESNPSDVYPVRLSLNQEPAVLLVDGFDKWFVKPENPSALNNGFLSAYAKALDRLGISFETVDNLVITRSDDPEDHFDPEDYRAIIYMLGDEGEAGLSRDYSLNILEELALARYLENGGNLFLSGSQLCEDFTDVYATLDNLRMNDAAFYRGYLKVGSSFENARTHSIESGSGIFSGIGGFDLDDGTMNYDISAPDIIWPGQGASVCLYYAEHSAAGIQYSGIFGQGTVAGKLVYLGFPYESIMEEKIRNDIMAAVMEYFLLYPNPRQAHTDGP